MRAKGFFEREKARLRDNAEKPLRHRARQGLIFFYIKVYPFSTRQATVRGPSGVNFRCRPLPIVRGRERGLFPGSCAHQDRSWAGTVDSVCLPRELQRSDRVGENFTLHKAKWIFFPVSWLPVLFYASKAAEISLAFPFALCHTDFSFKTSNFPYF